MKNGMVCVRMLENDGQNFSIFSSQKNNYLIND